VVLIVKPNNAALGSVTGTPSGVYNSGGSDEASLTAEHAIGYTFLRWTSKGVEISTAGTLEVTLTQDTLITANFGKAATYNITTPNTLQNQDDVSSVTHLTLTGTINAIDVKFMRDSMPYLTEVDLSGVNIAAFEGEGGTYPWSGTPSYPANEMPQYSFFDGSKGKTSLAVVKLPYTLTSFGNNAFGYCTGLTDITNYSLTPQNFGNNVFSDVPTGSIALTVPSSMVSAC
jgi:hypothetical protein